MSVRPIRAKNGSRRRRHSASAYARFNSKPRPAWVTDTTVRSQGFRWPHVSLKVLVVTIPVLFLALSVGVSTYENRPAIGGITFAPEYNGQTHTRTPILTHTTTVQPTGGNAIFVTFGTLGSGSGFFAGSTLQSNGAGGGNCWNSLATGTLKSGTVDLGYGNSAPTGTMQLSVYSATVVSNACVAGTRLAASDTQNLNLLTLNTFQTFNFTFSGGNQAALTTNQKIIMSVVVNGTVNFLHAVVARGSNQDTTAYSGVTTSGVVAQYTPPRCANFPGGTGAQTGCITFALAGTNGIVPLDFSLVRWNYNSTCVTPNTAGNYIKFDYSLGTTGSKGSNCNSADIALMKSPVNLQTVSERMLEIDMAWVTEGDGSAHATKSVALFLRTNATLPTFTENYDPANDPAARLWWVANPTYATSPGQNAFIARDSGKSINSESQTNDQVISGPATDFTAGTPTQFQLVLNYTGPFNLIEEAVSVNTPVRSNNTLVGSLQPGQNYYVGLKSYFDTTVSPTGNIDTKMLSGGSLGNPALPKSFQIFTVPSLCQDPVNVNVAPCAATPNPFNLFDPSTWAGAAVAGIGWIGNQAQGLLGAAGNAVLGLGNSIFGAIVSAIIQAISALAPILSNVVSAYIIFIQTALNALGTWAGWGNIGDQFINFVAGAITYFTTGLGDALTWLIRLILRSIDLIKILNLWVNFYLTGLLNLLANLLALISFVVTIAQNFVLFMPTSYVLIELLFFIWYSADQGLAGWHNWFESSKWMAFISYDILERMINFGISSITWLIGRIPTLDGTVLPTLPTVVVSGGPNFPSNEMTAIRNGDFGSFMGIFIGAVSMFWWMTSGLAPGVAGNSGFLALAPLLYVFVALGGIIFIVIVPFQLFSRIFGLGSSVVLPEVRIGRGGYTSSSGRSTATFASPVSGQITRSEKKAKLVINRGLGAGGLRPHLRKPKPVAQAQLAKATQA